MCMAAAYGGNFCIPGTRRIPAPWNCRYGSPAESKNTVSCTILCNPFSVSSYLQKKASAFYYAKEVNPVLTFEFTGVEGRMTESEILTSGMVGKTVQILFDDSWTGLTKTAVFRTDSICRTVPWDASVMAIPEDVLLQPFRRLYVGVFGTDAAGTLAIPTVMAEGPMIRYGADPTEDSTAEDLPVWKKLRDLIGDPETLETEAKDNLVAAINEIHAQLQQGSGTGLSRTAAQLLIDILRHAVYETGQSTNIDALEEELLGTGQPDVPEKSLSHISASYSGGSVSVGTSVHALTGITVTGHYSDGSTAPITGYSLSGTIAFAGANTVAVIYDGLTAYFTVTAVAKTLTGITAVYTGGSVPVGTAVSALLTTVSVTAAYGDGTTAQVTGFTLSGQISNVGENLITVTYEGKTATVSVTGTEAEVYVDHLAVTYTGGSVPVGTALTDLTGLTVSVVYSDGSSSTTTRYTLSGQISNVGSNTVTVSYSGKTAAFTVTATAAGSGDSGGSGTLLYSWDYTQSLADSVAGVETTVSGAVRDADGLHFSSGSDMASTGIDICGKTVEVEFGPVSKQGTGHGRCIIIGLSPTSNTGQGLVWHSTGFWATYGMTAGGWSDSTNSDANAISGATVRIPFKTQQQAFDITLNDEVFIPGVVHNASYKYLFLGSTTSGFCNMTVKKLRIYEGA